MRQLKTRERTHVVIRTQEDERTDTHCNGNNFRIENGYML